MAKKVLVIGAGLGGLATALRLSAQGYNVEVVEKHHTPGGRLNQFKDNGFTYDQGPSFFSMSYEFTELFKSVGIPNPLKLIELNPLYAVNFAHHQRQFLIHKDLGKLAAEFADLEPDFKRKAEKYLQAAKEIFHDTEYRIVKRNYTGAMDYAAALTTVPLKHGPKLFRSMWAELQRHFTSEEVKVVFSLVAFFLGATPFDTPSVYSLLNYTELVHDGYWCVEGGMYKITETVVAELQKRNVPIHYNTEIVRFEPNGTGVKTFVDQKGKTWSADVFVCNSDAAAFRGQVLQRPAFSEAKLDKLEWTLAPFTIYLGVKGRVPNIYHHNYFLGSNFTEYASNIFKQSVAPQKPYYYVNVPSVMDPACAPPGCENLFILCPVPDLRHKADWSDTDALADTIIADLGRRVGYDLHANTLSRVVFNPIAWRDQFNLYKGSGLGLAHGLNQVGGLRPKNKDEKFNNLYYVGASTVPGTGLPIVVISSRLVTERINKDFTPA